MTSYEFEKAAKNAVIQTLSENIKISSDEFNFEA